MGGLGRVLEQDLKLLLPWSIFPKPQAIPQLWGLSRDLSWKVVLDLRLIPAKTV